jgi:hypothetical protein
LASPLFPFFSSLFFSPYSSSRSSSYIPTFTLLPVAHLIWKRLYYITYTVYTNIQYFKLV